MVSFALTWLEKFKWVLSPRYCKITVKLCCSRLRKRLDRTVCFLRYRKLDLTIRRSLKARSRWSFTEFVSTAKQITFKPRRSSSSCCYSRSFNPPDRNVYALLCGYHRKIIDLLLGPVAGKCSGRESCGLFRAWPSREKDQSLCKKQERKKRTMHRVIIVCHNYAESTDTQTLPAILKRLRSREPQWHFIRTCKRLFSLFSITKWRKIALKKYLNACRIKCVALLRVSENVREKSKRERVLSQRRFIRYTGAS